MDPITSVVTCCQAAAYFKSAIKLLFDLNNCIQNSRAILKNHHSNVSNLIYIIERISNSEHILLTLELKNILTVVESIARKLLSRFDTSHPTRRAILLLTQRSSLNDTFNALERQKSTLLLHLTAENVITTKELAAFQTSKSYSTAEENFSMPRGDLSMPEAYPSTPRKGYGPPRADYGPPRRNPFPTTAPSMALPTITTPNNAQLMIPTATSQRQETGTTSPWFAGNRPSGNPSMALSAPRLQDTNRHRRTTHKEKYSFSSVDAFSKNPAFSVSRSGRTIKNIRNGNHSFQTVDIPNASREKVDDEEEEGCNVEDIVNGDGSFHNVSAKDDLAKLFIKSGGLKKLY